MGNTSRVPAPDWLVEGNRSLKHILHACGLYGVPRKRGSRFPWSFAVIKGSRLVEHTIHIDKIRRFPGTKILIKGISNPKHTGHISNIRGVPVIERLIKSDGLVE